MNKEKKQPKGTKEAAELTKGSNLFEAVKDVVTVLEKNAIKGKNGYFIMAFEKLEKEKNAVIVGLNGHGGDISEALANMALKEAGLLNIMRRAVDLATNLKDPDPIEELINRFKKSIIDAS